MTKRPCDQEELEVLLMDYAVGALNEVHSMFVSSYISLCPDARNFVSECEQLGGTIMEKHCPPVKMSRQSLDAVLQRLSEPPPEKHQRDKEALDILGLVEDMLPAAITNSLYACMQTPWRWRTVFPGVKVLNIPVHNCRSKAALIKVLPGAKMPAHEHRTRELTLVLDGSFTDRYGRHGKGDILICDAGTVHSPVASHQEGCLMLHTIDSPVRHRGFYAFLNIIIKT